MGSSFRGFIQLGRHTLNWALNQTYVTPGRGGGARKHTELKKNVLYSQLLAESELSALSEPLPHD